MALFLIIINSIITTFFSILINASEKSAQSEAIFFGFSIERISILFALFFVLATELFLLLESIKFVRKKQTVIKKFLQDPNVILGVILFTLCYVVLVNFLFLQNIHWFGDYYILYKKIEPTVLCFYIFIEPILFIALFWYGLNFLGRTENDNTSLKETNFILLLFLVLVLAKIIIINKESFGLLRDYGESIYFRTSEVINGRVFLYSADKTTTHQPFLYSVILIPAFFIKNNTYNIIKIINVMLSTSSVLPIYLIARQFLNRKISYCVALLISVIPYQFLIPTRILSENLYFPLFFWTIFFVFTTPKNEKHRLFWDSLTGIFIGFLYLTRFITLAIIPALLISWWLKPFNNVNNFLKFSWRKCFHFIFIFLLICFVYSPWILINLQNGFTFRYSLGFGIAENTNKSQLTIINLLKWSLLYIAYILIVISPYFNLFSIQKNGSKEIKRWFFQILIITFFFLIAVVRHSWRAWYNNEIPVRIMGRYLIYILPLFIILAYSSFIENNEKPHFNWIYLLKSSIFPIILAIISYLIIFSNLLIQVSDNFIDSTISIDGYYIKQFGSKFLLYLFIYFVFVLMLKLKTTPEKILKIITFTLITFYLIGLPDYLIDYRYLQSNQIIGAKVVDLIKKCKMVQSDKPYEIYIPADFSQDQRNDIYWTLKIQNFENEFKIFHYDNWELNVLEKTSGIYIVEDNDKDTSISESVHIERINNKMNVLFLGCEE